VTRFAHRGAEGRSLSPVRSPVPGACRSHRPGRARAAAVGPVGPVGPRPPVVPRPPSSLCRPRRPVGPIGPVGPVRCRRPVAPVGPGGARRPVSPAAPSVPSVLCRPRRPSVPSAPVGPAPLPVGPVSPASARRSRRPRRVLCPHGARRSHRARAACRSRRPEGGGVDRASSFLLARLAEEERPDFFTHSTTASRWSRNGRHRERRHDCDQTLFSGILIRLLGETG